MENNSMTDLEHDLSFSLEWENTKFGVDTAATAKNLSKRGYQKIVWHNAEKELPNLNKNVSAYSEYVLGYDGRQDFFAVVSWDGTDWTDENGIYYNITHWAELPKFDYEE